MVGIPALPLRPRLPSLQPLNGEKYRGLWNMQGQRICYLLNNTPLSTPPDILLSMLVCLEGLPDVMLNRIQMTANDQVTAEFPIVLC